MKTIFTLFACTLLFALSPAALAATKTPRGLKAASPEQRAKEKKEASEWETKTDLWWGWQTRRHRVTGEIQQKSIYGSQWRTGKDGDLAFQQYQTGLSMAAQSVPKVPEPTYTPTTRIPAYQRSSGSVPIYPAPTRPAYGSSQPEYYDRATGQPIDTGRYSVRTLPSGAIVAVPRVRPQPQTDLLKTR